MRALLTIVAFVVAALAAHPAAASRLDKKELQRIRIDQRIGNVVPLNLEFENVDGEVKLSDVVGDKPIILALVYNRCPMLCDQVLQGLIGSLKVLELDAGTDFDVLVVSFDPEEDAAMAADARTTFLRRYRRDGAGEGVHFLTGDQPAIDTLTDAVGFRYEYDEQLKQYAHAAAITVLTPEGKVARYFFGSEYSPRDLRFALHEASNGDVGELTTALLLLCYQYDPQTGTYSASVVNAIRVGGIATVLALAWFIGRSIRRDRKNEGSEKK
jgi:protein SCO1/2